MFRRYSIVPVVLVLAIASAAVTSKAQSGRGRQLRIQGTLRSESVAPEATEAQVPQKTDRGFPDAPLEPLPDVAGCVKETSVVVGHLLALTIAELTPKLRPDRREL